MERMRFWLDESSNLRNFTPQAKWYVIIWYKYSIPLTCLKFWCIVMVEKYSSGATCEKEDTLWQTKWNFDFRWVTTLISTFWWVIIDESRPRSDLCRMVNLMVEFFGGGMFCPNVKQLLIQPSNLIHFNLIILNLFYFNPVYFI